MATRAKELGLTHAEVARRAGLSERRFGNYVTDTREPDLQTLAMLARMLSTTADNLLGLTTPEEAGRERELIDRINNALGSLAEDDLELVAVQVRAIEQHRRNRSG